MSKQAKKAWGGGWHGRWIWDREPEEAYWWRTTGADEHLVFLRRSFELAEVPTSVPARATCDSRYVLSVNGIQLGRGPIRSEPEFLGWDEYDLAPHLTEGRNVVVALCRYYGRPGPWWLPASPLGTLGRGSFCFETEPSSGVDIATDPSWRAAPAPWIPAAGGTMHGLPPEVVDGRRSPHDIHDPAADESQWPKAVVLAGRGHGTVLDRPPAAPYSMPLRRPIPQLESIVHAPRPLLRGEPLRAELLDSPVATWAGAALDGEGKRLISVWDVGQLCLGHITLTVAAPAGSVVDVVAGEDVRGDGLPETRPREWSARYLAAGGPAETTFFDPVGFRFVAAHYPPGAEVSVSVEETRYPRPAGATFECDDGHLTGLWTAGARTVDVCSTDAFLDCPGREQRAWIADAYVQILVSLVTNPDRRLVRHHIDLTSRSRFASGLLAGAAACDFARIGFTMPEYSLHWIRSLAAYWRYARDETFVRGLLPVAEGIIGRYEAQRAESGLLEDFPGWVFLDWAQNDRDFVTGAHDALYAAALADYAELPGAHGVGDLLSRTADAFEALWDAERHIYVDALGRDRRSRRMSQHTNAAALVAGIVPADRVETLIERITRPDGRLVVTANPAVFRAGPDAHDRIPVFQYQAPENFDEERDVVAAQPWFCRFLHEALFRYGRRDLILESLRRWELDPERGTLQEFWDAAPGASSRCHGWSASPTYDLTTYVLGVRPAGPGYAGGAIVDPYLGPLARAAGRVPTPRGWLAVSVDGSEVTVDAPDGLEVKVLQ
ncbi:MAG: hypothetical protein ABR569_03965 [Gaiellaceae bacterium]